MRKGCNLRQIGIEGEIHPQETFRISCFYSYSVFGGVYTNDGEQATTGYWKHCYIGFVGDGCSGGGGGGGGSSSGRGTNSSGILQSVKLDRLAWAWLQQRKQTIA